MRYANKLFFFMHPETKKVCEIYDGRSLWEDHRDKADWVVVKVQGPAMDHWEEAMDYGRLGSSQPMEIDLSKYTWENSLSFKPDALAALGVSNHPKAEMLFSIAWEYGHGAGYREVWYYLQDLVKLIKE